MRKKTTDYALYNYNYYLKKSLQYGYTVRCTMYVSVGLFIISNGSFYGLLNT